MITRALRLWGCSGFAALFAILLPVKAGFAITAQDVPPADLAPATAASPAAAVAVSPVPVPSPAAADEGSPADTDVDGKAISNDDKAAPDENGAMPPPSPDNSNGSDIGSGADSDNLGTNAPGAEATSESTVPPPALDAASMAPGPQLGSSSLDGEIKQTVAPGLAASLRLTEQGREQLGGGQTDEAMRTLARAVSVDPSDAFAYYYLGRAHLQRKNYEQALTFFRRAELGFSGRPDWMAEAATYEGACDEELGKTADAAKAYQRALAASPNNLRARVGYGRVGATAGPVGNLDTPPPEQDLSEPAAGDQPESAPNESSPAPAGNQPE